MPNPRLIVSLLAALVAAPAAVASAAEKPPLVHVKPPAGYRVDLATYFHDGLVRVQYYRPTDHDRRSGFLDAQGRWAIPPRYDDAGNFLRDGLLRVKEHGRWRFLDRQGALKIEGKWTHANDFSEGRAVVVTSGLLGYFKKWGYVDPTGKAVVEPTYDLAGDFTDGVAYVQRGGKFGLIGRDGEEILPTKYDTVRPVGDGLVWVREGDRGWYADAKGKRAIAADLETGFFDGGFGVVGMPGDPPELRVIVDRQGRPRGAKHRGLGNQFHEGFVEFQEHQKFGYKRGSDGATAIPPRFDGASGFSEGLAAVQVGKKWGYIDHTGAMVIQPRFDLASGFKEHLAAVREGSRAGFIDRAGEFRLDLGESKDFWGF